MDKQFTISELESFLNCTQFMIDNLMREANINKINDFSTNKKLRKLTKYRTEIISLIETQLDEAFKED